MSPLFTTTLRAALALVLLCWSSTARAEPQVTVSTTVFERSNGFHKVTEKRHWISYDDCIQNDIFTFSLSILDFKASQDFEVWAGAGCTEKTERDADGDGCWLVEKLIPTRAEFTLEIPVRRVVARKTPKEVGSGIVYPGVSEGDCSDRWQGNLTFFFMYVDTTSHLPIGEVGTWEQTGVDTVGPSAPTLRSVSPDDQALALKWNASEDEPAGYRFYCSEAADADLCGSPDLVAGEFPSSKNKTCGSATGSSATSGFAKSLDNGLRYAVAVAAVDDLENVGPLSNPECGVPAVTCGWGECADIPVGGNCSVQFPRTPKNPLSFGPVALGLLCAFRLRRTDKQ